MKLRYTALSISVLAGGLLIGALAFAQDNTLKFKLKPGANGKLCLQCHPAFEETLKKPFVHTPLKNGECTGCHSPHASSHGKMLSADADSICQTCHAALIPKDAGSTHKVVAEGKCMKCHDPHASNSKYNL